MPKDRYELEGKGWLSIARAAKLLGTNAQGVRKLIGAGALEWRQWREDSFRFIVDERPVMALAAASGRPRKVGKSSRSPDPLARARPHPFPAGGGPVAHGGGASDAHRIRMTLAPAAEQPWIRRDAEEEKKVDPGSSPG